MITQQRHLALVWDSASLACMLRFVNSDSLLPVHSVSCNECSAKNGSHTRMYAGLEIPSYKKTHAASMNERMNEWTHE